MRSEYDGPVLTDNGNSLTCLTKEHDEGFMLKVWIDIYPGLKENVMTFMVNFSLSSHLARNHG